MNKLVETKQQQVDFATVENVLIKGDLKDLTPRQRADYYNQVCVSIGVNPLTQPFGYIYLSGKLVLYARKECTDQLRRLRQVSVEELSTVERNGVIICTAKVRDVDGRRDAASGAVSIANLQGDVLANALMKAETKAKRRATLSICGLGWIDQSELDTTDAEVADIDPQTGEITTPPPKKIKTVTSGPVNYPAAAAQAPPEEPVEEEGSDQWWRTRPDKFVMAAADEKAAQGWEPLRHWWLTLPADLQDKWQQFKKDKWQPAARAVEQRKLDDDMGDFK